MGPEHRVFLLLALLPLGFVCPFSISHRSERDTDLAEALAILQRQRRRVGVEDFLNSERLLEGRPLTLEDVNDWLSRANENDVMSNDDWLSETGNFKDFEPSDAEFDMPPNGVLAPTRVKATENEVDDIFNGNDDDDDGGDEGDVSEVPVKKTKEEIMNLEGDANKPNKETLPDASQNGVADIAATDGQSNREALSSLTDEEVRVLMKAVGKLQQRASELNKEKKSTESSETSSSQIVSAASEGPNGQLIVSQPASKEELKSVFTETDGPISKETKIIVNKEPGQDIPEVVKTETLSQKLADDSTLVREREMTNSLPRAIEDELEAEQEEREYEEGRDEEEAGKEEAVEEAAAAALEAEDEKEEHEAEEELAEEQAVEDAVAEEIANMDKDSLSPELVSKYLLLNRGKLYVPNGGQATKRTAKRASGMYANDLPVDVGFVQEGGQGYHDADSSALIQAFVAKILALQSEIDSLRFKNRLEDLENDELTDALNEATMGQREGSVSNVEWKSLQHAIEIEQALQDVKKKELGPEDQDDENDEYLDDDDDDAGDYMHGDKKKRGEPWKRTVDADDDEGEDVGNPYAGVIASRSSPLSQDDSLDVTNEEIARLLQSATLMKNDENDEGGEDEEEEEEEEDDNADGRNEDDAVASLFLSNADQCPAVRRYSSNCALADVYDLPVDFEARALCNLHQMCYACGNSLSVSQAQCDLVYRAAVTSLCHQKEVCIAESEIFLRTMKLKTRYVPHAQPACRARCTAQFMGMF